MTRGFEGVNRVGWNDSTAIHQVNRGGVGCSLGDKPVDTPKCSFLRRDAAPLKDVIRKVLKKTSALNPQKHGLKLLCHKNYMFVEKRGCGSQSLTLEPPLPDEQRRSNGAPDGRDTPETGQTETRRKTRNSDTLPAGRAT